MIVEYQPGPGAAPFAQRLVITDAGYLTSAELEARIAALLANSTYVPAGGQRPLPHSTPVIIRHSIITLYTI